MNLEDAFGLEQVFDGNTDFNSTSDNNRASTAVSRTNSKGESNENLHATADVNSLISHGNPATATAMQSSRIALEDTFALQAERAAEALDAEERHEHADGGEVAIAMTRHNSLDGKEIIPYKPDHIKVCKEVAKKSRNPICSFPSLMSKRTVPKESPDHHNQGSSNNNVDEDKSSSLALSCGDSVQHDLDTLSEISSTTSSLLSLQEPSPLLTPLSSVFGNHSASTTMNPSNPGTKRIVSDLPDVHGKRDLNAQVQMRRLSRQLDLVRSENEQYQKQASLVPNYKQEMAELRSATFDLQRENANLKSQLTSARELVEYLQVKRTKPDEAMSTNSSDSSPVEQKAQLRKMHDEIFRLKTEITKLKLDLKSREDAIKRTELRYETMENSSLEIGCENQKLKQKIREVEAALQSEIRSKLAAEQSLSVLNSERESFMKSRDWYRDQMHQTQEARSVIQSELMKLQKESSSKSASVEKLKIELLQANKIIEGDRERAFREKEGLLRKLEDLQFDIAELKSGSPNFDLLESAVKTDIEPLAQTSAFPSPEDKNADTAEEDQDLVEDHEVRVEAIDDDNKSDVELITEVKTNEPDIEHKQLNDELEDAKSETESLKQTNEELQAEIEVLRETLTGKEHTVKLLQQKLEEVVERNEMVVKDREALELRTGRLETKASELEASDLLIKEELRRKTDLIGNLREDKISDEMAIKKLKGDVEDLKNNLVGEMEGAKELRESLRKTRERLDIRTSGFEKNEVELRFFKSELGKARQELEAVKTLQEENLALKKQMLKLENLDYLEEQNRALASDGEAKDEEIQKLELKIKQLQNEVIPELNSQIQRLEKSLQEDSLTQQGLNIANAKVEELEQLLDERNDLLRLEQNKSEAMEVKLDDLRKQLEAAIDDRNSAIEGDESYRELQAQKIARLEGTLKVYESEVTSLTNKIFELEEQILGLEQDNGRLVNQSNQNLALKNQINQLQEDIAKDTALRKELLKSLELAKSSLNCEIGNLERSLMSEKESHNETRTKLVVQEHECAQLRVDRRSLQTGLEAANMTVDKLKLELMALRLAQESSNRAEGDSSSGVYPQSDSSDLAKEVELKEARDRMEEAKMAIVSLEDQLGDLRFSLQQKSAEVASLQGVVRLKEDSYESECAELRVKADNLRLEVIHLTRKLDRMSEEKNSYRRQVQDMNLALKTSLEHIKRLRSTNPLGSSSTTDDDESTWSELLSRSKNSGHNQAKNLSSLQHCLASLKSEMAVLQKKLAPSSSNPNSGSSSAASSNPNSPLKTLKNGHLTNNAKQKLHDGEQEEQEISERHLS